MVPTVKRVNALMGSKELQQVESKVREIGGGELQRVDSKVRELGGGQKARHRPRKTGATNSLYPHH